MEVDQIYSNTKLVYSLIVIFVGLLDNCVYLFRKFIEQAFQMGAESEAFWPNEEHFLRLLCADDQQSLLVYNTTYNRFGKNYYFL